MRKQFLTAAFVIVVVNLMAVFFYPPILWSMIIFGPFLLIGLRDITQERQTIRRNFPVIGHFRYLLEAIRPEINQYFIESNTNGVPFSREDRSIVYQRAKKELDTLPFGTQKDVYAVGYEWINHSIMAKHVDKNTLRVTVGGPQCAQPYSASLLNISAMSFGSISKNAVLALNGGAKDGNFAHNTGEGGLSPYHMQPGGDLIWQIGTGYFSCRTPDGKFCEKSFQERAVLANVKMIEIKISQGAKPGHGGILPAKKVSREIADIRGVIMGEDVISPPSHSAFSTPMELMHFIARLRELSGGKPVGFKLCIGKRREFLAICKAMVKSVITPDYIAVDGGEGGTGAAPLEFSNNVGAPGIESLVFVNNALMGFDLRDRVRIITSGKVTTAFGMIKRLALGADLIYSARAMMLALGCIQALRCNTNACPTGVATQDLELMRGLVVGDKRNRVATFHGETIASVAHLLGAMGLERTSELRPWHIMRRVGPTDTRNYGELFERLKKGALLRNEIPESFARAYRASDADSFRNIVSQPEIGY